MIKQVNGNILDATNTIICHQVNCQGVVGSGIALQIKNKYPQVYSDYMRFYDKFGRDDLLGRTVISRDDKSDIFIMSMFSQYRYGRDKRHTDYEAMRMCFEFIKEQSDDCGMSISIPYKIGCGLAGGDWNVVYKMIEEVFEGCEVVIYKFE